MSRMFGRLLGGSSTPEPSPFEATNVTLHIVSVAVTDTGTISMTFTEDITGFAWDPNMFNNDDEGLAAEDVFIISAHLLKWVNFGDPQFATPGDNWNWNFLPPGVIATVPINGNIS